jgi:bacillithiol biosynthesis cysteine-adding enzyme BshC
MTAAARTVCHPSTELPGTSALVADYLYNFGRVARFYDHSPHEPESVRRAALAAGVPDQRRLDLAAALRHSNGDSAAVDLLELPDTVAVVTGQQVGLFSGPAYTVYKALTAAKLARQLTESGIRAVPVFWLATEDHDFEEIDHCYSFGPAHRPIRLVARGAGQPEQPVGSRRIVEAPLAGLRASLEGLLYADEVFGLVEECYQPGRTFGEAFRMLLQSLLAGYGLVFFDPLDPAIRRLAAPLLAGALERADELSRLVLERDAALRAAGYHAQVHFEPQTSLFFWMDGERRLALRRNGDSFFHATRRLEHAELAAEPDRLSPNALLRPVMQDYLLPTAAYVGGPAELAYLAQSNVLYRALLGRSPVAVPRSGFTLLDERARLLMERHGLTLPGCLHGEEALKERIAAHLVPAELDAAFAGAIEQTTRAAGHLEASLAAFDPTLASAMAKSKAKMLYQLGKNRRKAAREALRRNQQVEEGAAHLAGLIFPERHLQERVYSLVPFLAKHGLELLDTLYEHTYRGCPDHLQLTV